MYRCKECQTEYKEKVDYCDCGNNTFDYIEDTPAKPQRRPLSLNEKSEIVSRVFFAICLIFSIIVWFIPIGQTPQKKQDTKAVKQTVNKTIPKIDKIWDDTPIYQPKVETQQQPKVQQQKPIPLTSNPADYAKKITEVFSPQPKVIKPAQPKTVQKTAPKTGSTTLNKTAANPVKKNDIVKPKKAETKTETPKKIQQQTKPVQKTKPAYNPNSTEMLKYKGNLRAAMFSKLAVGGIQGSGECSVQFSVDLTGKLINRKFVQESDNKSLNDAVYYMMMSVPKFTQPPASYNGEPIRMNFKFNNGNYEISIQ